jgi:5-methylcytosine-specific restriction enzyme subunit McrC
LKIPIRNLYYLLSYVWNVDWEMEWSSIDAEKSGDALNLLTRILATSTDRIIRRGLDRGYKEVSVDLNGVRGRIDIANTIKRNGFSSGKLTCGYEELDHSVLHNQIIKTTLTNLVSAIGLDKGLREEILDLIHRLRDVEPIELNQNIFSKVRFHSNIRSYRLPISVCKLIYDQLLPSQTTGKFEFVNITDEKLFRIFEKFIFNFYKKHLNKTTYTGIKKDRISWQDTSFESGIDDFLPWLETDVSLFNAANKLVIECKFYETAIQTRKFGEIGKNRSFISAHINQLFVYLKNLEIKDKSILSGMIIYPENGEVIDSTYSIHGHKVLIKTINLETSAQEINDQMISCLNYFADSNSKCNAF